MKLLLKKYNRLCIVDTPYTLLLYLLYCTEDEIDKTFFLLGDNISDEIRKKLPKCFHFSQRIIDNLLKRLSKNAKLYLRFRLYYIKWLYYHLIKCLVNFQLCRKIEIFCIDHIDITSVIVGKREYTLIEDSPQRCSYYVGNQMEEDQYFRKNMSRIESFLAGPIRHYQFGSHPQCRKLLFTQKDDSDYLRMKELILVDIKSSWKGFSERKRLYILDIFNYTNDDLNLLKSRNEVFFTQPLYKDVIDFSMADQIRLYKKILSNYSSKQVLIKVHPRDEINYSKYFPEYNIFKKQGPSQLMEMTGACFERAITVFSTAVNLSYPIEIDWYGTEVDKKIYRVFGHKEAPKGAVVRKLNDIGN